MDVCRRVQHEVQSKNGTHRWAGEYWDLGLGYQHWFSPQIEVRPEVVYYHSVDKPAYNGNANGSWCENPLQIGIFCEKSFRLGDALLVFVIAVDNANQLHLGILGLL